MLSIVSTPIGNLEDLTFRALRTLKEADTIACEDTRVTTKLLQRYEISRIPLTTLHQHSLIEKCTAILDDVRAGKRVAYVSDAGTPNVNDPGGKLMELAHICGVPIEVIPGPSALTAAIAMCGFPMERFTYLGFLPLKKHRKALIETMAEREDATVFFESTHRIQRTVDELANALPAQRRIYIGRELTKQFETHYAGTIIEIKDLLSRGSLKGEFVIIIGPT